MNQEDLYIKSCVERVENNIFRLIKTDNIVFNELYNFLRSPSKRIRTKVSVYYIKALGGNVDTNCINVLTAGELIHNASLLHDDVIDSAQTRRGEETFAKKLSPHMSILAGDFLLSLAVKDLLSINNQEILNEFLNCTQKMSEAEIVQFSNRGKTPTFDEYIKICEGKTAALFEAILVSLAILTGIDKVNARKFAKKFGVLFQINNDLMPDSIKNDSINCVKTAVDILGIEKTKVLTDNYKEEIRSILNGLQDNGYKCELEDLVNKI